MSSYDGASPFCTTEIVFVCFPFSCGAGGLLPGLGEAKPPNPGELDMMVTVCIFLEVPGVKTEKNKNKNQGKDSEGRSGLLQCGQDNPVLSNGFVDACLMLFLPAHAAT